MRKLSIALGIAVAASSATLGGCGSGHSAGAVAGHVTESFQSVPGEPFGVVTTRDGRYAFLDLATGQVLVYSVTGSVPHLVRTIAVPGSAIGSSLTRDGRLLLVANAQGATVISVARAEHGDSNPVLGSLVPSATANLQPNGAIETASSADGRYVFVSLEYGNPDGVIAVYDLGSTLAPRFGASDYVGVIPLGEAVVGSVLSPNGRYLYVTSEGGASKSHDGTLSVINVATAEHDPAKAVVATVPAMLQPVRVALSPDGSVAWVTARASNRLLGFSTSRLLSDPTHALVANVKVGTAPVGVAVFDHGDRVIVADSNRFNQTGAHSALTIVSTTDALAHQSAVISTVRAGGFPREMAVERNDTTVLVSNFASDQLESVSTAGLR